MKIRRLVFFCAFAVLLCLLPGCFQTAEGPGQTGSAFEQPQYDWGGISGRTLTIWGREAGLQRTYIIRALERYEELTGNAIRTVAFSESEFTALTAEDLVGEDAPDLVLGFGGATIDAMKPDENFYDFSDAVWVDDLTDTSINQAIYHGKIIGLPHWEASVSGTVYNKKLFEKLGLRPPETRTEFMRVCEKLLENGVTPLYLPGRTPSMLLYQFPLDTLLDSATLSGLNDGTLGYPDLPEMAKAVDWYRTMAEKGYLGESYAENTYDGMGEALRSGRYAMALCWDTWIHLSLGDRSDEFGLMSAYIGVPEEGTFEGPNLSLMMVNLNGGQVDAAVELVTFLADPYNYNAAFAGIYAAPVFKNQLTQISTPQYVEAASWIERRYCDSAAWLRIRGFSQTDACYILEYMQSDGAYTREQCLQDMEESRRKRFQP